MEVEAMEAEAMEAEGIKAEGMEVSWKSGKAEWVTKSWQWSADQEEMVVMGRKVYKEAGNGSGRLR